MSTNQLLIQPFVQFLQKFRVRNLHWFVMSSLIGFEIGLAAHQGFAYTAKQHIQQPVTVVTALLVYAIAAAFIGMLSNFWYSQKEYLNRVSFRTAGGLVLGLSVHADLLLYLLPDAIRHNLFAYASGFLLLAIGIASSLIVERLLSCRTV